MIILSLDIDRFGLFEDRHLNFRRGLNIVNGAKGSGKTTLAALIKGMLYGLTEEERKTYYPDPFTGRYSARMTIETETGKYLIARDFTDAGELYVTDLSTGDDLADPERFLKTLTGSCGPEVLLPDNAERLIGDPQERYKRLKGAAFDNAAHLNLLKREKKRLQEELASRPEEAKVDIAESRVEMDRIRTSDLSAAKKSPVPGILMIIFGALLAAATAFFFFRGRTLLPVTERVAFLILCVLGGAALLLLLLGIVLSAIRAGQKRAAIEELERFSVLKKDVDDAEKQKKEAKTSGFQETPKLRLRLENTEREIEERSLEQEKLDAALKESEEAEARWQRTALPVVLDNVFRNVSKERREEDLSMLRKLSRQVILLEE